jgi:hypothetical protein
MCKGSGIVLASAEQQDDPACHQERHSRHIGAFRFALRSPGLSPRVLGSEEVRGAPVSLFIGCPKLFRAAALWNGALHKKAKKASLNFILSYREDWLADHQPVQSGIHGWGASYASPSAAL